MTLTRLAPPLFLVAADFDGAKKVLDEAAQLNLELGQQAEYALTLTLSGYLGVEQEDWTRARSFFERALVVTRDVGDSWLRSNVLQSLAYCGIQNGELERAAGLAREAIQLGFALEDVDVVHTVALLCEVAAKRRRRVLAGLLW